MMPTFPRSPLSFRTAVFPQYGCKAGFPSGAFPGRLIGAKPPLRPKHVWSIRTKLQVEERIRDLALFNVAIDSKLRGCDVVALKVEDVAPNGYAFGYSPGLLPAALTYASIACRVCSVNSKLTGCPVYFCCPVYF